MIFFVCLKFVVSGGITLKEPKELTAFLCTAANKHKLYKFMGVEF